MTQKELGDVDVLTHKAISMLDKGKQTTTVEKLALLAKFFHVSTDYLLAGRMSHNAGGHCPPVVPPVERL